MSIENFTPEYRALIQAAAKAKREAQIEFANKNLKLDFADATHWRSLASAHGVRLPAWYIPGSELKHIRRACRRLGIGSEGMREATGFSRAEDFASANPKWPAFALVGLLLEHVQYPSRVEYVHDEHQSPLKNRVESMKSGVYGVDHE